MATRNHSFLFFFISLLLSGLVISLPTTAKSKRSELILPSDLIVKPVAAPMIKVVCGNAFCVAVGAGIHVSDNGNVWRSVYSGTNKQLNSIAVSAGGRWVAVGHAGSLVVSDDGFKWVPVESGTTEDLHSIAVSPLGHWVATGDAGTILMSNNGFDWKHALSGSSGWLSSIAISQAERWVAVGRDGVVVTSSADGLDRKVVDTQTDAEFHSVTVSSEGHWVAVGENGALVISADGLNWELSESDTNKTLHSVAVSPQGHWVAVGEGGTLITSSDGREWHIIETETSNWLYSVAVSPQGHWVAVGPSDPILVSYDGLDWKRITTSTNGLHNVTFSTMGNWITVGVGSFGGNEGILMTSPDGLNWKRIGSNINEQLNSVTASSKGHWVAAGENGALMMSHDGIGWDNIVDIDRNIELKSVAVSRKGYWVAVGGKPSGHYNPSGVVITSANGLKWEEPVDTGTRGLNSVATSDSGLWLAVGDRGALVKSTDGIEWKVVDSAADIEFNSIAVSSLGHWVAVGRNLGVNTSTNGVLVTSSDALTWKRVDTGTRALNSVAVSAEGRWVSMGYDGALVVSHDGFNWDVIDSGIDSTFNSVDVSQSGRWAATGWKYLSRGTKSVLATSTDGFNWQVVHNDENQRLNSVTVSSAGLWMAVGNSGYIVELMPTISFPKFETKPEYQHSPKQGVSLSLNRGESQCEAIGVQLLAESAHNYRKKNNSLIEIYEKPIETVFGADGTLSTLLPLDVENALGLSPGQSGVFKIRITCNDRLFTYPIYDDVAEFTYLPWYEELWPWLVAPAYFLGVGVFLLGLFWLQPVWLLGLWRLTGNPGPAGQLKIPGLGTSVADLFQVLNLWLLPWLALRPRVLDTYLIAYQDKWKTQGFESNNTVLNSSGYVPLPCRLDNAASGELIQEPSPELLKRLLVATAYWVEVVGQGGAGKTMLTTQLGRWLFELNRDEYGVRIPILVEQEFSEQRIAEEFIDLIRDELFAATNIKLDTILIRTLLAHRRIIPIFDRLSEHTETTIREVEQIKSRLKLKNMLIFVSTRRPLNYQGSRCKRVYPQALSSGFLVNFMTALIQQKNIMRGSLFDVDSLASKQMSLVETEHTLETAQRLVHLIRFSDQDGEQQALSMTPLLVKLFVDQAYDHAQDSGSHRELPSSIPDIYIEYLKKLNPDDKIVPDYVDDNEMLKAAAALAKLAVLPDFVPKAIALDHALLALQEAGFESGQDRSVIRRLILNGVTTQHDVGIQQRLIFNLDPVAEYLAAEQIIIEIKDGTNSAEHFEQLKLRVDEKGLSAIGFLETLKIVWQVRGQ